MICKNRRSRSPICETFIFYHKTDTSKIIRMHLLLLVDRVLLVTLPEGVHSKSKKTFLIGKITYESLFLFCHRTVVVLIIVNKTNTFLST